MELLNHCVTPEINTTLYVNYTGTKTLGIIKKKFSNKITRQLTIANPHCASVMQYNLYMLSTLSNVFLTEEKVVLLQVSNEQTGYDFPRDT